MFFLLDNNSSNLEIFSVKDLLSSVNFFLWTRDQNNSFNAFQKFTGGNDKYMISMTTSDLEVGKSPKVNVQYSFSLFFRKVEFCRKEKGNGSNFRLIYITTMI